MSLQDSQGKTVFHRWAEGGGWDKIPKKHLTWENLNNADNLDRDSALSWILIQYRSNVRNWGATEKERSKVKGYMKHIFSQIPTKELKKLEIDPNKSIQEILDTEKVRRKLSKKKTIYLDI
jgi:hypothetical protein